MSEEIKFDHFKDINELLEHIDLWYREDDIEYTRWFGLEDLHILGIYITSLQQKVEQLENIRKEAIEYVLKNKLYRFKYDDEELFEITTDKKAKDDLLNILNKGSE